MLNYILILAFAIIFHELAHLLTALFWKVKVHACSLGFGKILLHKKWKNIDWRISLIPFGGYCDIEEGINQPHSLYLLSYWKQLTIILAGVTVNFLIACICYWLHYNSIIQGIKIDWALFYSFILKDTTTTYIILKQIIPINEFLLMCGLINFISAIVNLLPLPALDGGYLWLLLLRKNLTEKCYKHIIFYGFIFIIILQIYLLWYLYC